MPEGQEGISNIEAGKSAEKPVSEYTFREAFANRQRLTRQKGTASREALPGIEHRLTEVENREKQLVTEVEQEGGLAELDQNLSILKDMLVAGELSPSHLFDAMNIAPQLDNLANIDLSDSHAGVREWYYRKNLEKIAEDLRGQKRQTSGGPKNQPRAQSRSTRPSVARPAQLPGLSEAEKEVYGEGEAFSDRWVKARGIPTVIRYRKSTVFEDEEDEDADLLDQNGATPGEFKTAEFFSSMLETGGGDPRLGSMFRYLLEAYPGSSKRKEIFSALLKNGFIPLVSLKDALNSGRIDTLAKELQRGPSPQGIAQWLLFDPETRRSLSLILRLQGYEVANEKRPDGSVIQDEVEGLNGEGVLLDAGVEFADYENIRADQINIYLNKIKETVGTDPGVVKIAYIIFRILGHAHENSKYATELIKKYTVHYDKDGNEVTEEKVKEKGMGEGKDGEKKKENYPNRDLALEDIASFLVKFEDPTKFRNEGNEKTNLYYNLPQKYKRSERDHNKVFLVDVLEKEGVEGLAVSLNRIPAQKIVREWDNMQILLDMMDSVSDARTAQGKHSGLPLPKRHTEIVKEMGLPLAKRLLSPASIERVQNISKIKVVKEMEPSEKEKIGQDIKKIWSDITGRSRRQ